MVCKSTYQLLHIHDRNKSLIQRYGLISLKRGWNDNIKKPAYSRERQKLTIWKKMEFFLCIAVSSETNIKDSFVPCLVKTLDYKMDLAQESKK